MVYRPPYPWYIDPQPMLFWPPCPWNIDPPTYGISNPLLWYYELLSFGRNEGGSIYHDGVQNTMTKNGPWGQNTKFWTLLIFFLF
jgi:hypothetical protein